MKLLPVGECGQMNCTVDADLRMAIAACKAGDQLLLGGGIYGFGSRFNITAVGRPEQPIVIQARDGEDVLVEMNTGANNFRYESGG